MRTHHHALIRHYNKQEKATAGPGVHDVHLVAASECARTAARVCCPSMRARALVHSCACACSLFDLSAHILMDVRVVDARREQIH